jgi:hypothetical protein
MNGKVNPVKHFWFLFVSDVCLEKSTLVCSSGRLLHPCPRVGGLSKVFLVVPQRLFRHLVLDKTRLLNPVKFLLSYRLFPFRCEAMTVLPWRCRLASASASDGVMVECTSGRRAACRDRENAYNLGAMQARAKAETKVDMANFILDRWINVFHQESWSFLSSYTSG